MRQTTLKGIVITGLTLLVVGAPAWSWTAGSIEVEVSESPMKISVSAGGGVLAEITGFVLGSRTVSSLAGQSIDGNRCVLDLGEGETVVISPVTSGIRFSGAPLDGGIVEIVMNDLGGHYFGCRGQVIDDVYSPDLRGRSMSAHVESGGEVWNANLGGPLFLCSRGYGSYFDTFARGEYHFAQNGETRLTHDADSLDWYLFYGPGGDRIFEGVYEIIGRPKKPTTWAMGPCVWRNENEDSREIVDDCAWFTENKIPLTMLWIDRPYSDGQKGWNKMNFSYKFANPAEWIGTLNNDYNIELCSWIYGGVFGETIEECSSGKLDFSRPECIRWYQDKITENQYSVGVVGHKMDDRYRGDDGSEWFYRWAKITDEMLRAEHGRDQFNFMRTCPPRAVPHVAAVWGGDVGGGWDGLKVSLANMVRGGFMGFPVWGSDGGGFSHGTGTGRECLVRWLEFCAWSGFCQYHLGLGHHPENQDEEARTLIRKQFEIRMDIFPYVYSLGCTSYKTGVLQKPLPYVYPSDENTYDIYDQYLFGPYLLVAPVYSSGTSREVYLPEGEWIDYHDRSTTHVGGKSISVDAPLGTTPLFIRRNAIYPTGYVYGGNMEKFDGHDNTRRIVLNVFPGAPGEKARFTYVDPHDGDKEKLMQVETGTDGSIKIATHAMEADAGELRVWSDHGSREIVLNDNRVEQTAYDAATKTITASFNPGEGEPTEVVSVPIRSGGGSVILRSHSSKGLHLSLPRRSSMYPVHLSLHDMRGRCLRRWGVSFSESKAGRSIHLRGRTSGMCVLRVSYRGGTARQKVLLF